MIEVVEESGNLLDAVVVPKVNRREDLYVVDTLFSPIEGAVGLDHVKVKVEAQIESAAGLVNVDAIANATERLEALHFGPVDYAASVRIPQTSIGTMDEWDHSYPGHRFHYVMQRILVTARVAGIRAPDGPVADYRHEEGLREIDVGDVTQVVRDLCIQTNIAGGRIRFRRFVADWTQKSPSWVARCWSPTGERGVLCGGDLYLEGREKWRRCVSGA